MSLPQIEQFISLPSTESYSRRTSITPSSSKVRWCGVVVELHWLGNLAFFLRPPTSTASKTSLVSMVVSGMLSHQQCRKKRLLNRRNAAQLRRGGWDATKKFFSSFSTRSQKYELFAFWQQQQSRLERCDWSTREQWNRVEWQTVHMRGRWLDKITTRRTWLEAMNGLSREKIERKMARIISLGITVRQHGQKRRELFANRKGFRAIGEIAPGSFHSREFWKIFTRIRSLGERPIQTNLIQLRIYVRFKLPVTGESRKPVLSVAKSSISGSATFLGRHRSKNIGKHRAFPQTPNNWWHILGLTGDG